MHFISSFVTPRGQLMYSVARQAAAHRPQAAGGEGEVGKGREGYNRVWLCRGSTLRPPFWWDYYKLGMIKVVICGSDGLFTPQTRTRQNFLVLSAVVFTPPTRQDKTVFVASPTVFTPPMRTRQNSSKLGRDETKLSCQRCE